MRKGLRFLSILLLLVLCLPSAAMANVNDFPLADSLLSDYVVLYEPMQMTDEERAAANLFLSNFTETGIDSIGSWHEDIELVDFAHDHIWFNDHDEYEYGEYFGENNCRVSDDDIQRIVDKYFYDAHTVDLSQTRFDYLDGYYYHCETGGWTSCGFAYAVSICPIGDDVYFASFMVFGGGYDWDNSVMDDTLEEITSAFTHPDGYGSALIHAEDLSDRSTYKLISYSQLR